MAAQPEGTRKRWLVLGLICNIALLCSFKYVAFVFGRFFTVPNWDFPLGISFFTLTQIMYLVDVYQGLNGPIGLFDHATVVSFFPYVSSGPIVRAKEVADQLPQPDVDVDRARRGLYLFALGLAKKVVLADTFATVASTGFAAAGTLSTVEAWAFALAYSFQIYFDFSGYSDMAVGSAALLGFEIPQNFDAPYRSTSISEFWQRWHISLSRFITNYLYTPILRSFGKATLRTSAVATFLAMGIAGFWHGPAWTYIIFGLLHGAALAVNQVWKKKKLKLPPGMGWLATFLFVVVAFVVFRSPTLSVAGKVLWAMVPHGGNLLGVATLSEAMPWTPTVLVRPLGIGVVLAFFFKSSSQLAAAFEPTAKRALATAALVVVCFFFLNSSVAKQFVYFAF
jgi:alginate O-acetyltransferase complex protein AlgI